MKQIKDPSELESIIKKNPYILSLEPEETNELVEVVMDFQNRNYDSAPKTESLLQALKEIQQGQKENSLPVLDPACDICED